MTLRRETLRNNGGRPRITAQMFQAARYVHAGCDQRLGADESCGRNMVGRFGEDPAAADKVLGIVHAGRFVAVVTQLSRFAGDGMESNGGKGQPRRSGGRMPSNGKSAIYGRHYLFTPADLEYPQDNIVRCVVSSCFNTRAQEKGQCDEGDLPNNYCGCRLPRGFDIPPVPTMTLPSHATYKKSREPGLHPESQKHEAVHRHQMVVFSGDAESMTIEGAHTRFARAPHDNCQALK